MEAVEINKSIHELGKRIYVIEKTVKELTAEKSALEFAREKLELLVCKSCRGSGNVMRLIKGCECDGPRQQTCPDCYGTGNAKEPS